MDDAKLARILQEMQWDARPHGDNTLRVVLESRRDDIVVYVRLTDNWLIASVVPFLVTRGDNSFELSRWLLRMNRDMYQTKFAYDEDGDVVLTVELPTESLDDGEVKSALTNLVRHAEEHRATLYEAAS